MTTRLLIASLALAALCAASGCGTTKQNEATNQLLTSDAVDRSVAMIDFSPLEGQTVYFDVKYLQDYKGIGFVNSNYVISSLRQQLFAAGCLLQEKPEDADYIVEGRIGTLGNDEHNIVYGIPANNGLNAAAIAVPNSPPLPAIPEISFARKDDQLAAAKIAAFAYHRDSNAVVWQSGLSVARSTSKDTWILGAGPFERGTIHDGWSFAGTRIKWGFFRKKKPESAPVAAYKHQMLFQRPSPPESLVADDPAAPPADGAAADSPAPANTASRPAAATESTASTAATAPAPTADPAVQPAAAEEGDVAPAPGVRQATFEWARDDTKDGGG